MHMIKKKRKKKLLHYCQWFRVAIRLSTTYSMKVRWINLPISWISQLAAARTPLKITATKQAVTFLPLYIHKRTHPSTYQISTETDKETQIHESYALRRRRLDGHHVRRLLLFYFASASRWATPTRTRWRAAGAIAGGSIRSSPIRRAPLRRDADHRPPLTTKPISGDHPPFVFCFWNQLLCSVI